MTIHGQNELPDRDSIEREHIKLCTIIIEVDVNSKGKTMEETKVVAEINHKSFINQLMDIIPGIVYMVDESHKLRHYNKKFSELFDVAHLEDFTHEVYENLARVLSLSEQEIADFKIEDNVAVFSEQVKTDFIKVNSSHPGVKEHYKCVRHPIFDGSIRYLVVQMIEVSNDEIITSVQNILHPPKLDQNLHRILLVDPIEVSRISLKEYFEKSTDIIVECAFSEKEALEIFMLDKYSLIITETDLADGPGFSLIKKIRKKEKGTQSHVPIIAITEIHKLEELADNYKNDGADGIIGHITEENAHKLIEHYVKRTESVIDGLIKLSDVKF